MKYVFAFLAATITGGASAQTPALATQFPATLIHVNPAFTGLNYKHAANVLCSGQTINPKNPDRFLYANYALRFDKIRTGIGFSYSMQQVLNASSQTGALHLAHHFKTGESSSISIGLTGGIRSFAFTTKAFKEPFRDYYAAPEITAGIAYHWQDLNAGVSLVQLNQPEFNPRNQTGNAGDIDVPASYWMNADYTFHLTGKLDLQPQIQIVAFNGESDQTLGINTIFNERFRAGVNYNYDNFIGFMIGYDIRGQFRLAFSQDFFINEIYKTVYGEDSFGKLEVSFGYLLR